MKKLQKFTLRSFSFLTHIFYSTLSFEEKQGGVFWMLNYFVHLWQRYSGRGREECHAHLNVHFYVAEEVYYCTESPRYKYIGTYMLARQSCILLHYMLITTKWSISITTMWCNCIPRELSRGVLSYQLTHDYPLSFIYVDKCVQWTI